MDIDGCVFEHRGNLFKCITQPPNVLPGVIRKINEWIEKDYMIILVTGRKECMRKKTEEDLLRNGIVYDKLVMGLPRGERVLINDSKPSEPNFDERVASAIEVERNTGLTDLEI